MNIGEGESGWDTCEDMVGRLELTDRYFFFFSFSFFFLIKVGT